MSFGKGLNAWRDEWEASEELRFQFPLWNDYAYRRLRQHWDASPELQRRFGGEYKAFRTAAKKEASEASAGARKKLSDDAARAQDEQVNAHGGVVSQFTRHLFRKA